MLRDGDWTAVTSYVTGLASPGFKAGVKPERAPFKLEFTSISDQPKLEFSQKEKKSSAANYWFFSFQAAEIQSFN